MPLVQVKVPYREGYDYGIGADLASGSPMGMVVDGEVSGVRYAPAAITRYDITRIHSTSELESKLGINVEASYGCAAFGAGISARFGFAKDSKIQSSSLFMTVTANVLLGFTQIDVPALTPRAVEVVNRIDVFSARYGNMFVRGINRGGLFVGVLQIDTKDSAASESISAELSGSYGLFSAEAKAKFAKVQRDHRSEIHISVYHEGGPIDLFMRDITRPDELYNMLNLWLKAFQDNADENAVPYYVTLAPITIAEGPIPPNAAQIQTAQDILVLCANQRSAILDHLNLMDYIMQNPARFDFVAPTSSADIVAAFDNYQMDLDLIAATASCAINDVTKAVTPATFAKKNNETYPKGSLPTPMPTLKQGLPQPELTIRVASLLGLDRDDLDGLLQLFAGGQHGTVAAIQAARNQGFAISKIPTQEQLDFICSEVRFMDDPPSPGGQEGRGHIVTQVPSSGMLAPGSKVILQNERH